MVRSTTSNVEVLFLSYFFRFFICCVCFYLSSTVLAEDAAVIELTNSPFTENLAHNFEFILDPSDELTPFEIMLPESKAYWQQADQNILNFGRVNGAIWIKFRINAQASIHKQWELIVHSAMLDYIDVYQMFADAGPRVIYRSGMARPFNNRSEEHRYFIVPLDVYENPETFLLRIETNGASYIPMSLYPKSEFWAPLQLEDVFNWLFFGIILAMALYNLFLFWVIKDISYLYYVLFITNFALLHLSVDGYLFQYFWPEDKAYNSILDIIFLSTTALFGFLFVASFLELKHYSPRLNIVLITFGLVQFPITLGLLLFTNLNVDSLMLPFAAFLLILAAVLGTFSNLKGLTTARYFCVAWMLFAVGNGYLIAVLMGATLFELSPYVVSKLAVIAEAMLLSFALAHRIRALKEDRENHRLKVQAQSYFLAHVSHEIRTPLNGVLGTLELMSQTKLNDEQKSYLDLIQSSGWSLLTLVNDVLDYTKIEAGKMAVQSERVEIHDLVRFQIELYRSHAEQKNLELTSHIDAKIPKWIESDAQRIRQILSNLISNAIKFTDAGYVRVMLSIESIDQQAYLCFKIKDSGIGISQSEQKALFEAYQQIDSERSRHHGGVGLGLAICKELAELLDGKISVNSELNEGSEFKFIIPLKAAAERQEEEFSEQPAPAQLTQLSILVAEDNLVNQKVIHGLLTKAGHQVTLVSQGELVVASRKNTESNFDLILMDCEMPLMDGYEAAKLVRKYERENGLPEVPIIALTAQALEDIRNRCIEAGMNDFLAKPINFTQLSRVISQVL
jgi:signal transduction histidine kinase/CheY-like chemotaxis protein